MNEKLNEFRNESSYFLTNTSSIAEALDEARKTQNLLNKIIIIEREFASAYRKKKREFSMFMSSKRTEISTIAIKNGNKPTDKMVDAKVQSKYPDEHERLETELDELELDLQAATAFKMAMFQRKDIIAEYISHCKCVIDHDSCIVKNSDFIKTFKELLG